MLHDCINNLIMALNEMESFYNEAREDRNYNFIMDVQPFTEKVDKLLDEMTAYEADILQMPLMNPMKYHLLVQHLKELSVECFYKKTSRKLFIDRYKAVQHDLSYILRMTREA